MDPLNTQDNAEAEKYIIKMEPSEHKANPGGIGYYCFEKMNLYKNKIALICTETGKKVTYGGLLQRAIRTAIKMIEDGIESSDIISLCTYNHLDSFTPAIAAQFLCCKVTPFDPNLTQDDTNNLMKLIKPKLIFINTDSVELIENAINYAECLTQIVVFGSSNKYVTFDEYLKESDKEENFRPVAAKSLKETAFVLFSSGTTGLPKGICLTHRGLLKQNLSNLLGEGNVNNFLGFTSPYWISHLGIFMSALTFGYARFIVSRFTAETFWRIINEYHVDFGFLTPDQMFDVINLKPLNANIKNLKYMLVGGSSITAEQMHFIRQQFPHTVIIQGYGLTEVCGCVTTIDPYLSKEILEKKEGSCGSPINGFFYKIVDVDTGKILGPYKAGELWLKSEYVMNGYYNMDSSECWDKDGYMRTGDMLYYDEDKYFYYVDRIKEMFKYKSWHVQPNVIERVILQHPAVLSATVIGIPHPTDGDHPMALVKLKNGYETTTVNELIKFTNERVHDRQQLRAGLRIVQNVPVTPTGKVQRRMLRNLIVNKAF